MPSPRFGIGEWFGEPLLSLSPERRSELAKCALGQRDAPLCPFQTLPTRCSKRGGVCSLQKYESSDNGRIDTEIGGPVVVCPRRFEESQTLLNWLAEVVAFDPRQAFVAREVPFMLGTRTNKPAGMIDLVVAGPADPSFRWYGLEIQAVYFSGIGMTSEFEKLINDENPAPPFPNAIRRPDWRSSGAKRLMPQLEVKVPTLRRWGSKLAVAVDRAFFEAIGGRKSEPSRDLDDGDIIWLVPEFQRSSDHSVRMARGHWEVLTLEQSRTKLLAAETISRRDFEATLRRKLQPLG